MLSTLKLEEKEGTREETNSSDGRDDVSLGVVLEVGRFEKLRLDEIVPGEGNKGVVGHSKEEGTMKRVRAPLRQQLEESKRRGRKRRTLTIRAATCSSASTSRRWEPFLESTTRSLAKIKRRVDQLSRGRRDEPKEAKKRRIWISTFLSSHPNQTIDGVLVVEALLGWLRVVT